MSRNLFALLLSELQTVRVICPHKGCGCVTEVSVERLRTKFEFAKCPICGYGIGGSGDTNNSPLYRLAKIIEEFNTLGIADKIEFVLPADAK